MLYVAYGADDSEKASRADALNQALQGFIDQNLNFYRSEPQCGEGCRWDDSLQMCVCDGGMFSIAASGTQEAA
jgi:hypothetical protein